METGVSAIGLAKTRKIRFSERPRLRGRNQSERTLDVFLWLSCVYTGMHAWTPICPYSAYPNCTHTQVCTLVYTSVHIIHKTYMSTL